MALIGKAIGTDFLTRSLKGPVIHAAKIIDVNKQQRISINMTIQEKSPPE